MKKQLIPALFIFLCALYIYPQPIDVVMPKTGNFYNIGSEITILWNTSGLSGDVRIVLRKADGSSGYVIKDQHPATQVPVKYKIPNNVNIGTYFVRIKQGTRVGESGHFKIRMALINAGFQSAKNLKIVIPISSPTVGSHHKRGDSLKVRWNKDAIKNYSKVHIFLYTPDEKTKIYTLGSTPPDNTGQFNWTIPHTVGLQDYIIKVTTPDNKISGKSAVFSVSGTNEKPSITTSFYPHINNPSHRAHWDNHNNDCLTYSNTLPLATPLSGGIMRVGYRARIGKSEDCRWHDWDFLRGFLLFDITKARGTIKSATLSVKLKNMTDYTPMAGTGASNQYCTSQVEIYAVQGDWSKDTTGYHVTADKIADFHSASGQRKNFDVTQWVKDAFKGGNPYKITFMAKGPDEQEKTLVFNIGDTACIKYFEKIYLTIVYVPYF